MSWITLRRHSVPLAIAGLLGGSLAALSLASAEPAGAQDLTERIRITAPLPGETVDRQSIEVRGHVDPRDAEAPAGTPSAHVLFAIDVSASTSYRSGLDCNGDGESYTDFDDFNASGYPTGDVLDCQIAAVTSLNSSLAALPGANGASGVRVGVIGFGASAQLADLDPGAADGVFVPPGAAGLSLTASEDPRTDEVTPWVSQAAASMDIERIQKFTRRYVNAGTSYRAPIVKALDAFDAVSGPKYLYLLTDGDAATAPTAAQMTRLADSGVQVRTFAIGNFFNDDPCAPDAQLQLIAAAGEGTCLQVNDPSVLTAVLAEAPKYVERVEVTSRTSGPSTTEPVPVNAKVDALGNWTARVEGITEGPHYINATAYFSDGTTASDSVSFNGVAGQMDYIALGDSYGAGEGIEPYTNQSFDDRDRAKDAAFLCHRSTWGWPTQVKRVSDDYPLALLAKTHDSEYSFDFRACSGATMPNLNAKEFRKKYRDYEGIDVPLQFAGLTPSTDLVTVSMGGNDIWFSEAVAHCAVPDKLLLANCFDEPFVTAVDGDDPDTVIEVTLREWAELRMALISSELRSMYKGIRDRTSPDTMIVATTYPRLIEDYFDADAVCGLIEPDESEDMREAVDTFAQVIGHNAQYSGVLVADVRDAFNGHLACDTDEPWMYNLEANRTSDIHGGIKSDATLHPTRRGAEAYAGIVNDVLAFGMSNFKPSAATAALESLTDPDAVSNGKRTVGSRKLLAAAADDEPLIDPRVATHPEVVIASYPKEVVEAVQNVEFGAISLGAGDAAAGLNKCQSLVAGEMVPFAVSGFAPNTDVEVTVATAAATVSERALTLATNADGRASGSLSVPASATTDTTVHLQATGTGPKGGMTLAASSSRVMNKADCPQPDVENPPVPQTPPADTTLTPTTPPALTGAPSGKGAYGSALATTAPTWNQPDATSDVQWLRDGAAIAGATFGVYYPAPGDIGHQLTVRWTGKTPAGNTASVDTAPILVAKATVRVKASPKKAKQRAGKKVPVSISVLPAAAAATGDRGSVVRAKVIPAKGTDVVGKSKVIRVKARTSASGRVVLTLPKLRSGMYQVRLTWAGTELFEAATTRVKLKVRG